MKTDEPPSNIDQYIATFPDPVRNILKKIRMTIRRAAPNATERISYRIPTFFLEGNLVHFAAFKRHIGFFPTASGVAHFKRELLDYQTSKGTIQFPLDQPIPYALIKKIAT